MKGLRFLLPVFLSSYIFVVEKEKDKTSISTIDTSYAFHLNDSLKAVDSARMADSARSDTAIAAFFSGKEIDTRGVHPEQLINFAKSLIGTPYKYASTDPKQGFDCSGFITYVFNHFKIVVPRSSIDFTEVGQEIPVQGAKPGDLILFTGTDSTEKFVGHMGLIVTNSEDALSFIHSTSGKAKGVTITPFNNYYRGRYMKTIRIFPQNNR